MHEPSLLPTGRPLRSPLPGCRVISRAPGLKLVVETLISSLRPIGNIVLICCAFFIIFGILGVQVCGPGSPRVCPTLGLCSPLVGWVLSSPVGWSAPLVWNLKRPKVGRSVGQRLCQALLSNNPFRSAFQGQILLLRGHRYQEYHHQGRVPCCPLPLGFILVI